MDEPIEIHLEEDQIVAASPLADVAAVMASLLTSIEGVNAHAVNTRVYVEAEGAMVTMNVLAVSADADDVLG